MAKERILLKISGGNLKKDGDSTFFSHDILRDLVEQIKSLSEHYSVSLVVGGGNIWRGRNSSSEDHLQEKDAHMIGMLATMLNAIAMQNYLSAASVDSTIFSAISCPKVAHDINSEEVEKALESGKVIIFAAGSGCPFFTTDTCSSVRALEIGASRIFVGKSGTDGIYDSDPNKNKDAVYFERISYEDIIQKNLQVMDLTSICLLKDNGRPKIIVFNQSEDRAFLKAAKGDIKYSEIY